MHLQLGCTVHLHVRRSFACAVYEARAHYVQRSSPHTPRQKFRKATTSAGGPADNKEADTLQNHRNANTTTSHPARHPALTQETQNPDITHDIFLAICGLSVCHATVFDQLAWAASPTPPPLLHF